MDDDEFDKMILESTGEAAEKLLKCKRITTTTWGFVCCNPEVMGGKDKKYKQENTRRRHELTDFQREVLIQKMEE